MEDRVIRLLKELTKEIVTVIHKLRDVFIIMLTASCTMLCYELRTANSAIAYMGITIMYAGTLFGLNLIEHRYNTYKRKERANQPRFTWVDSDGNPCISTADLHEIVEFLYRLEEGEDI